MQETISASTAELARLSELIDTIYQGATEPSRWSAILPAISDWIGGTRGLLFTPLDPPDNGGFYFTHEISAPMAQLWWTKYSPQDIWAIRSAERGLLHESNIVIGDEVVPFEELSRTEIYRDFFSKHDIAHLMSGIVFGLSTPQTTPYVVCTLVRGLQRGSFTPSDRERLAILIPHLSRSLGVMTRLRDAELKAAASLTALDRLNNGVLLFNAHGLVAFANRAARNILEAEDGLRLKHRCGDSSLGEIVAENSSSQNSLACAIRSAVSPDILQAAHFSRAAAISRPSGRQDYTLNFSSLAAHNEFGSGNDAPRAIAFITDSAEPIRLDSDLLKKTYGLTPAEIRLAGMLTECQTVEETAERLGVSKHTARTQLQSVYMKTNTNNRAKLMRLLLSLSQLVE